MYGEWGGGTEGGKVVKATRERSYRKDLLNHHFSLRSLTHEDQTPDPKPMRTRADFLPDQWLEQVVVVSGTGRHRRQRFRSHSHHHYQSNTTNSNNSSISNSSSIMETCSVCQCTPETAAAAAA